MCYEKVTIINNYYHYTSVRGGLFALTALTSCDNFLNGGEVKKEIDEAITYNNTPSVSVLLKSPIEVGEFFPDGEKSFKVGYDSEIQFSVNLENYVFNKLEAVSKADPAVSRAESVSFTTVKADDKKGVYKINVKILSEINDILIRPVCTMLPKLTEITPKFESSGCDQDTPIKFTFIKPVKPESFTDAEGKVHGLSIYSDDRDLTSYFGTPYFSNDNTILYIPVDSSKLILLPDEERKTLNIEINYDFTGAEDADGLSLKAAGIHQYKINKTFGNQKIVKLQVESDSVFGKFLSAGEKECTVGYTIDIQFTVKKAEYKFINFEAVSTDTTHESRNSCVSFENLEKDDDEGVYKARVRVSEEKNDIMIRPVCLELPKVTEITPKLESTGCDQDSVIQISFNKAMEPESFKDKNGKYSSLSIISQEGDDLSAYFGTPYFSSDGKTLCIKPLAVEDPTKLILPPDQSKAFLNIQIQYIFAGAKDMEELTFTQVNQSGSHEYKINKNFGNQKIVKVQVESDSTMGKFLSSGEKECTVGYTFDIQFSVEKADYKFVAFEAISDGNKLGTDIVSFEDFISDDENGIYKARVRINKEKSDIHILPKCIKKPKVLETYPRNSVAGVSCANNISVTFNKPVALSDFCDFDSQGGITGFKNIQIYCGTQNLLETENGSVSYFDFPKISDDGTVLTIPSNKKHLLFNGTESSSVKDITVSIITSNVADKNDSILFENDVEWTYRVNNSVEISPHIENIEAKKTITNYDGTTKTSSLVFSDKSIWQESEYIANHVKDFITFRLNVNSSFAPDCITIKETLLNYSDTTSVNFTTSEEEYEIDFSSVRDYEWQSEEFDYYLTSADGLIQLDLWFEDTAHNVSDKKTLYLVKDTAFTLQILGYGLESPREVCDDGKDHVSFRIKTEKESFYGEGAQDDTYVYKYEWYSESEGETNSKEIQLEQTGFYTIIKKETKKVNGKTQLVEVPLYDYCNISCNPNEHTYINIYMQDAVGNLNKSTVIIPARASVQKIVNTIQDGTDWFYYYARDDVSTLNCSDSVIYVKELQRDGEKISEDSPFRLKSDGLIYTGIGKKVESGGWSEGKYILTIYNRLQFSSWYIYGTVSKPFVFYKGEQPPAETVEIPNSISFTMLDAVQNERTRTITADFELSDEQRNNGFSYNPSYEYLIKAVRDNDSSFFIYYTPGKISLDSNYKWKLYPCVRTSNGNIYTGEQYVLCDASAEDNSPPEIGSPTYKDSVTRRNLRFCTNSARIYSFPTDKSEMKNKNGIVTLKYFFLPNNGSLVELNKTEDELMEYIRSGNYKTISYDLNNKPEYLSFPFDGLGQDYYTLFILLEDNSPLKNYTFYSNVALNSVLPNLLTEIRINEENSHVLICGTEKPAVFLGAEYFDGNNWVNYKQYTGDSSSMHLGLNSFSDMENSSLKYIDFTSIDESASYNHAPDKFLRVSLYREVGNPQGISYPLYFYYNYYTNPSDYPCKNKSINPNVIGGIQINADSPVLVHTFYCSRNLGNNQSVSYKEWLAHGIETGVQSENGSFTYADSNLKNIPEGKFYTTIVHFADGTVLMTDVKQK